MGLPCHAANDTSGCISKSLPLRSVERRHASTCLIFEGEKIDQRRKFFAELKKCGEVVEFKRLYENQLGPFIREELAGQGVRIEAAAVELLVYYVGNDLRELAGQLDKLVSYAAGRRKTLRGRIYFFDRADRVA